ncbi:argininosuccinate lyase [Campylobacter pinnipediorum]|uniref:argininosuccinate lyase n=1 Tax=Campylobacter pinnipediorum TaxID=1965231 RepID=UPI0009951672|nr:argininosuccinate lyase [Campylobacter pinnipediorum]AQW81087.1 argininosuccinate lyase [Campylobacter pinnipediorum subsp. pinnipediorum]AQW82705.1 argininosuccinate lyase [Campylobacter pinnipediorum subsp. pinnipediorum]OPA78039.1 argininosuccinate lyase [Campylobacter pinnipediorum subsp. pinnipediorum]
MEKMWSGRFNESSSELLEKFNASINFDKELYLEDINGSKAHVKMLAKQKIITEDECLKITDGLNQILKEIIDGDFIFDIKDEDIHMSIEKRLSQIVGSEIGGKLHTARSRNDQVALDFRLYFLKSTKNIAHELLNLITTLKDISSNNLQTIMPGYTHLQHAQPVSLAFHLMAYSFMFMRDFQRLESSFKRNNLSPLGSCALAGTPHNTNRDFVAEELGFEGITPNAMDGVSDRDFALELLFNISVIFTHTSRLCEEIIMWSSSEFGFIKISDKFSTGSSIMPQKKNPDVAELIRGKTGRVYGNLIALLTTMKALPLAYNKDMQEDKEGVFDSVNTALSSLVILNQMLKESSFNKENMKKASMTGHLTATDLADFLVREKNIAFRQAHFITGKIVAKAEELGKDISELNSDDIKNINENIDNEALKVLDLISSMQARKSKGGTSTQSVKEQIDILENWIKSINF